MLYFQYFFTAQKYKSIGPELKGISNILTEEEYLCYLR